MREILAPGTTSGAVNIWFPLSAVAIVSSLIATGSRFIVVVDVALVTPMTIGRAFCGLWSSAHLTLPVAPLAVTSARASFRRCYSGEFARHERGKDAIGTRAFYCDPHSLWQRDGIEKAY